MLRRAHRPMLTLALAILLLLPAVALASSVPSITGEISGTELCPEFICGEAIFAGSFSGIVDGKHTTGSFSTSVTYISPLPTVADTFTVITGGSWFIWTKRGTFFGDIQNGRITANGDNTFTVSATLELTGGGTGTVTFLGTLNHNVFPPTIIGTISQ